MKDRFQYRAKDVKTGEWRYGYYTELPCGLGSSGVNGEYADTDAFILNYTKKQSALYSNAEPHEVVVGEQYKIDKKTLSQCTGLKDKNGKMIYEGDIIQRNGELLIVRYQKELACFAPQHFHIENDKIVYCGREWFEEYTSKDHELYAANCYEVIGNIYMDSHLLDISNNL